MLTEQEVVRSWRKMFKGGEYDEAAWSRPKHCSTSCVPKAHYAIA